MATTNFKSSLLKIASQASQNLPLPFFLCLLFESLSNSQILSLIFTQLLTQSRASTLTTTLNQLLSYIQPFNIFDPFTSESFSLTMLCLSFVYIFASLAALFFSSLLLGKGSRVKIALSKALSLVYLVHSRIFFFPIHCFLVKALQMNKDFCENSNNIYCKKGWIAGVCLTLILNIIFALIKETLCYTIHKGGKSHYTTKGNHQPLLLLIHKIIVVLLFYLLDKPDEVVIICNVGFCVINLLVLHLVLPFYSLKTLRTTIIWATITTICSIISIARISGYKKDLALFSLCLIPVAIKISLLRLRVTLWTIFKQRSKRPYQAIHLPVLIEEYTKNMALFPVPEKLNRRILFSLAFIKTNIPEDNLNLRNDEDFQMAESEAYKAAVQYLTELQKKYPNNQLLLVSMMEIHVDVLKDTMKAIYTINRLRNHPKLNLQGQMSLEMVSGKFESSQFSIDETKTGEVQLDFFVAKTKTAIFKEFIKKEVNEHLELWRQLDGRNVDVMSVIEKAKSISLQSKVVAKYWNENFYNRENTFVSAAIIYGLYIQIIQALPFEGLKLARKAYKSIKNRFHAQKEVMDIIAGKSAIIAASIEPDKLGKIIEASSSVKKMFNAGKHGLVGTNINGVLPAVVASRHNGFIKNYLYRNSKQELNSQITNYARTLDGEYFKVKVSLLISPFTEKGLNVLAHIKRLSDNEPIMIIDTEGKIVEYSNILGNFLNINIKRDQIKIDALYPELERVNLAFNIFYKPGPEEPEEENQNLENPNSPNTFNLEEEESPIETRRKQSSGSQILSPGTQSSRRLLSNNAMSDRNVFQYYPNRQRSESKSKPSRFMSIVQMTKHEAEEICQKFKEGQDVVFIGSRKGNENTLGAGAGGLIKNKIEIEPLVFDGIIFKVLKFKQNVPFLTDTANNNKSTTCGVQRGTTFGLYDEFADKFPIAEEHNSVKNKTDSLNASTPRNPKHQQVFYSDSVLQSPYTPVEKSHFGLLDENRPDSVAASKFLHSKVSMDNSNSEVDSQVSTRITAKRINHTLQIERPNKATSLSISMVYLAIFVIVTSICVDLIFTKKSLQDMENAMNLVSIVNLRFSETLIAWQSVNVLYTRMSGLRPFDLTKIIKYQGLTVNASMVMLQNAIQLSEKIQTFHDESVTRIFYDKSIRLYDPFDGSLFNSEKTDSFTASNVLTNYDLYIGKYNKDNIKDLNGSKECLFVLNNTANDFMDSLENAIDDVSLYFDRTRTTNISLLKAIMSLEFLFVFTPLLLIISLILIILKLYFKLFSAVTNLLPQSVTWRINQLEKMQGHLEEDMEDALIDFDKFKAKEFTKIVVSERTASASSRNKEFMMKGLKWYTVKYLMAACSLVLIISILFAISLTTSIKNMNDLDEINQKALVSYKTGSQVKMVIPSFYFAVLFQNQSSYKIKNSIPFTQVKIYLDALGNSNNELLSKLSGSKQDIDDPVVKDILQGNVCPYVTDQFRPDCGTYTNGNAFGLLGLLPKFYQVCDVIAPYMNLANPTRAQGSTAIGTFSTTLINLHFVIYDVFDSMSKYFVKQFNVQVAKKISESEKLFGVNMSVMLFSMFLIRVIILEKLRDLQITVRRIVRLIPYKIIEENKIMGFYLAKEFGHELKKMRLQS